MRRGHFAEWSVILLDGSSEWMTENEHTNKRMIAMTAVLVWIMAHVQEIVDAADYLVWRR